MPASLDWIATPQFAADHRGPVGRPFEPFVDPARAGPIVEMLREVARRHPERIAVDDPAGALTHAAFWRAVVRASARIAAARATPVPVALLLPTGATYAVAVYACLAAGCPGVMLDPAYPAARNAAVAAQAGARLVLVASLADAPSWPDTQSLSLEGVLDDAADVPDLPQRTLSLDEPAVILCTSGSEGLPKPIAHSQRTLLHWARTTHNALHVDADDRVLSLSSFSTLGGFTGLLNFTLAGATLQLLDVKAAGLGGLLETLATRGVTLLRAAPSMLRGLAGLPEARAAFAGLRAVQTYGEPLMKADVAALAGVLPAGCLVRTTYGSTEASGLSWFAGEPDEHDPIRVASGALMPDTTAAIVDDDGRSCPRGVAGELWIRSRYNALGEWQDGRLVPGRLERDPDDPHRRIYRTGDIARCSADGVFVVLGRKDRMLNIHGQRIEPAEIEAEICRHEDIGEAVVVMQEGEGRARLAAFAVPRAGRVGPATDLVAGLRSMLRERLPGFMVPSTIRILAALPKLPGGKVDVRALQATATSDGPTPST